MVMSSQPEELNKINRGIIEIQYCPVTCFGCWQTLVNTWVRKDDADIIKRMHIYCDDCFKKIRSSS